MKLAEALLAIALVAAPTGFGAVPALAQTTLHRGNGADPETLDQHKTSTVYEAHILRDLYEGLVIHNAKAEVVPGAAESWSVSPDGKTYTFRIRANAKWSNGDPVRAGDFVFSLRRIMDPATAAKYANVLYPIRNAEKVNKGRAKVEELGVRAVDERTLEIAVENPTAYFLELLTHQTGLPVHPASVQKLGADFVKPGNMVTNGPYTLVSFTPKDRLELRKSPTFHDAANVKIERVFYYPTEDRSAALRRFQAGELHLNDDIPTAQAKWIKQNLVGQFKSAPYLGTYYFAFNTRKKPFDDARVRRALSMVVDRDFLAEEIWGGTMLPGYSLVPPGTNNYGDVAVLPYKDQPLLDREEAAKKLLAEAGYGPNNPLKLQIIYNTSENHKNTSTAIADMWKAIGVETTLFNRDTATHYALLRDKGDFDVARAGWIADYNDPQNFLFLLESDNKGLNYATWANPKYDELMDRAAQTLDLEGRAKDLREAEHIAMQEEPYMILLTYMSRNLVSAKVQGWEANVKDVHPTRFLSLKP
jgi:oligopeptide transport system substrate-binding protein